MTAMNQPSGTVTLVFTDVEGSTRLLDRLGAEDYRDELGRHQQVVRDAFGRRGGFEVDTAGDGFFYAFSTAVDAANAVGEALRSLDRGPVRMRVGIHTGEPIVEAPKYVGLDVHRAARIMAAAHGGQALISRTTRDLLGSSFPIRDLGEHRLKDLSAPQRLFQLGTGEFPRPRTLHLTNLPVPPSQFVGRDRELAAVVEQLRSDVHLLTLTGPGGTGKTRLALQAAAEAADDFSDGVWWVTLAALRDPELILRQAARTLDVVEQPDRPLRDVLEETLRGRRMLLVLDNAEHLLPRGIDAIAALRDIDGPKLVVTSRERLRLTGEHVYPIPQLEPEEGIELFFTRATAVDPGFHATAGIEELCRRLDNLPLAIELAAARTTVLRPEQILARLGGHLDLLEGARDADPRQQTLRATIDWSYELLKPDERELCARFAVFAGGATLEAVEDVCETDLDTLASLVDKSLLRRDEDRFLMLETIREYGADRLDDDARANLIERHGAFFERFAADAETGLRGAQGAAWLNLVEGELPNLRSAMGRALERGSADRALRIATSLGRYWEARSGGTEGRSWLDQAFAAQSADDGARAAGRLWAGRLAFFQGDFAAAESSFAEAAQAARDAGAVFVEATASAYFVWVTRERGNPDAGREARERALALLAQIADPWERSEVLLALTAFEDGDDGRLVDEVVALKRRAGDVIAISDSLNNIGWEALVRGELDRAAAHLDEALDIARELRDTFRMSLAVGNLGHVAVMRGRYAEAVELNREALLLSISRGDKRNGIEALLSLAAALAGLGEDELSVELDEIHRRLATEVGSVDEPQLLPHLEPLLGQARSRLGPVRTASARGVERRAALERALELLDERRTRRTP